MLDLIFKSKIRKKLLLLFVYNPEKKYYINEIARMVGTSSGTAQRELEKLASFDILVKIKKANVAYFYINKNNPILGDLKKIIEKTIGLEIILKKELEKSKKIKFSFLFGSYVKGDFKADSDIDLYVIGDIEEEDLYKAVKKAEATSGRDINYHLAVISEFKNNIKKSFFHKEILKNHLLLTGNKNEFEKIIR